MSNKLEAEEMQEEIQRDLIKKMDTSKFGVHKLTVSEAAKHFATSLEKGLSKAEVDKRLTKYGTNELDEETEKSLWERIVEQFEDILVRILLASATISFVIAITSKCRAGRAVHALLAAPFVGNQGEEIDTKRKFLVLCPRVFVLKWTAILPFWIF